MRYIIYGAGAIGGSVGGHLFRAKKEVVFIEVMPAHVQAIRENGLKLVTPESTYTLKVPVVTAPGQITFKSEDVVFLCLKGQHTEAALRDLKAVTSDVPVFCFQNGIRNEATVSALFPRTYGVSIRAGGVFTTPGEVISKADPPGWLWMGRYPNGKDETAEAAASDLREAGYYVLVTPEIMKYKWGKLLHNIGNAINAITGINDDDAKKIYEAIHKEAAELARASGIQWKTEKDMKEEWPEFTGKPRKVLGGSEMSSSWQSLARGDGNIETDYFNGEITRLATKLGRKAPLNEALLKISNEMAENKEKPGKYPPKELRQMLGIT